MLFKTLSAAVFGIVTQSYEGSFNVVGLPDDAVKESRERIKSAVRNCGFDFPFKHAVTVELHGFTFHFALATIYCFRGSGDPMRIAHEPLTTWPWTTNHCL